ncbi:hypothetical protein PUN28_011633 [Cardiocondyla obscurior]|uniref:Uncharacterized protein n=1 Tax=Cardiocondyla obscurior TaxID=286306 RepID=A0AAW2FJF9_9HYME
MSFLPRACRARQRTLSSTGILSSVRPFEESESLCCEQRNSKTTVTHGVSRGSVFDSRRSRDKVKKFRRLSEGAFRIPRGFISVTSMSSFDAAMLADFVPQSIPSFSN